MKRVFLYVRVSTEEQAIHGLSIGAQTQTLEEWAKKEGHRVVGTYTDAGISARKPASKRPELQRLLQDVQSGKGDLIAFTKLDRWFRNISEYYKVQEILEKYNVDWKTIHEDYDTSNASGRLKINIMLSVAQDEADRTSERIKAINEVKRQRLEALGGVPPIGYKLKGKKWVKDPEKEAAVSAFFREYMETGSIAGSIQKLHDDFGVDLSYQLASKILERPTYCGRYCDADGMTPPYITWEEHEKIMSMRKRTVRKTEHNRIYLFSGLIVCGDCGKRMGGAFGQGSANPYYHCSGHYAKTRKCSNKVNMNEKKLANYIFDSLEEKIRTYKLEFERCSIENQSKDYSSEIASTQKKMDRLKYLFVEGLISIEEYKSDRTELEEKLNELSKKQQAAKTPDFENLEKFLIQGWRDSYELSSREAKRKFIVALIKEIRIYPDRHVEYNLNI